MSTEKQESEQPRAEIPEFIQTAIAQMASSLSEPHQKEARIALELAWGNPVDVIHAVNSIRYHAGWRQDQKSSLWLGHVIVAVEESRAVAKWR